MFNSLYAYIIFSVISITCIIGILYLSTKYKLFPTKYKLTKYLPLATTLSYRGVCYVELRKSKQQVKNYELREYLIEVIVINYLTNCYTTEKVKKSLLSPKYKIELVAYLNSKLHEIITTAVMEELAIEEAATTLLENEIQVYNSYSSIVDTNFYPVEIESSHISISNKELSWYEFTLSSIINTFCERHNIE